MNKERREKLLSIQLRLADLQSELDTIKDEEQEAFDNLPESLQEGERGEKAQEALDALENASNSMEEALDSLETSRA